MLTPGKHNFDLYRSATLRKSFIYKPGGVVARLEGYGGFAQFRRTSNEDELALNLTIQNGGFLIDVTTGKVTLYAPPTQVSLMLEDKYVYGIMLIDPLGDHLPFIEGECYMKVAGGIK